MHCGAIANASFLRASPDTPVHNLPRLTYGSVLQTGIRRWGRFGSGDDYGRCRSRFGRTADEPGRLCRRNLAVHGVEGDVRYDGQVNSYNDEPHSATGHFNYFPATPAFNDSDWYRNDDDVRWQIGVPLGVSLNN